MGVGETGSPGKHKSKKTGIENFGPQPFSSFSWSYFPAASQTVTNLPPLRRQAGDAHRFQRKMEGQAVSWVCQLSGL